MKLTRLFLGLWFCLIPILVYGEGKKEMSSNNNMILENNFNFLIKQANWLEKKDKFLYFNITKSHFTIPEAEGDVLISSSIPMVGFFCKKINYEELEFLKELANTILSHPKWIDPKRSDGIFVKIAQNDQSTFGRFKITEDRDQLMLLNKEYLFRISQMKNIGSYTPIVAIKVSHEIINVNHQTKFLVKVKNIGNKKITMKNPLILNSSSTGDPYFRYAFGLMIYDKSIIISRPDYVIPFDNGNSSSSNADLNVEINPLEEKIFSFIPSKDSLSKIPSGLYKTRVLLVMPFHDADMNRVVVYTDEVNFTKKS